MVCHAGAFEKNRPIFLSTRCVTALQTESSTLLTVGILSAGAHAKTDMGDVRRGPCNSVCARGSAITTGDSKVYLKSTESAPQVNLWSPRAVRYFNRVNFTLSALRPNVLRMQGNGDI